MVRLAILCLLAVVAWGNSALAGAWTQREGKIQIIVTSSRKVAPAGAFVSGAAESDTSSAKLFLEYGLRDDLTVGMTLYGKTSFLIDDVEAQIGLHARKRLWQGADGDVVSVQGGVRFPVERWLGEGLGDNRPDSVTEIDLRALYGRGWQTGWGNSFISSELGLTLRGEGQPEQIRLDLTAGHTPVRGLLGLFSIFASQEIDGPETTLKLSPSVAYTMWPFLGHNDKKPDGPLYPSTLQLGVTWDSLNPDDGLEVSLSVWKSF